MELEGSLYNIISSKIKDSTLSVVIELNEKDIVYKGHFPGFPVTPGVIQIKLTEELLSKYLDQEIVLNNITSCKFLKIIDPSKNKIVHFDIEYHITKNHYEVNGRLYQDGKTVMKLDARFSAV